MIHKTENNTFVISTKGVWRPGSYETRRAANYAFRFDDELLYNFQKYVNATGDNGTITFENLQTLRRVINALK